MSEINGASFNFNDTNRTQAETKLLNETAAAYGFIDLDDSQNDKSTFAKELTAEEQNYVLASILDHADDDGKLSADEANRLEGHASRREDQASFHEALSSGALVYDSPGDVFYQHPSFSPSERPEEFGEPGKGPGSDAYTN